jgi:arsenite-transporting ATPase
MQKVLAKNTWLEKVKQISSDNFVAIPWFQDASIENIVNFSGGSKSDE